MKFCEREVFGLARRPRRAELVLPLPRGGVAGGVDSGRFFRRGVAGSSPVGAASLVSSSRWSLQRTQILPLVETDVVAVPVLALDLPLPVLVFPPALAAEVPLAVFHVVVVRGVGVFDEERDRLDTGRIPASKLAQALACPRCRPLGRFIAELRIVGWAA